MSGTRFAPNPAAAMACAVIYSFVMALLASPMETAAAILPPIFLMLATCNDWGAMARRLRAPFVFVLFLCLLVPFTTPGQEHPVLGSIGISSEGLQLALLLVLKCLGLVAIFSALIAPMPRASLASALRFFHCPWQIITMFLLMDMNIHIIKKEWERLKNAAMLRAFRPGTNMRTYRTYGAMLALWLLRATERAKRIHEGLLLRGFSGRFPVTTPEKLHKSDYYIILITLLLASLFSIINLNADPQ